MLAYIARRALDEWLACVPINKIIAFGGDTTIWIEHAIGDLIMTRQNLAQSLARRMMLYDNAIELYDLKCRALDDLQYV